MIALNILGRTRILLLCIMCSCINNINASNIISLDENDNCNQILPINYSVKQSIVNIFRKHNKTISGNSEYYKWENFHIKPLIDVYNLIVEDIENDSNISYKKYSKKYMIGCEIVKSLIKLAMKNVLAYSTDEHINKNKRKKTMDEYYNNKTLNNNGKNDIQDILSNKKECFSGKNKNDIVNKEIYNLNQSNDNCEINLGYTREQYNKALRVYKNCYLGVKNVRNETLLKNNAVKKYCHNYLFYKYKQKV